MLCKAKKLFIISCAVGAAKVRNFTHALAGGSVPKTQASHAEKLACMGRLCFMRPGNPHKQRIFTELSRKRNCFFTLFFYNKKGF